MYNLHETVHDEAFKQSSNKEHWNFNVIFVWLNVIVQKIRLIKISERKMFWKILL